MNTRRWLGIVTVLSCAAAMATAQELRVLGGDQVLQITSAEPGQEPTPVVNTTTSLRYRRQSRVSKITIATSCPGQRFTLKARAVSVQDGSPSPMVTLIHGMPAADLIRDIPARFIISFFRNATVEYTASATFEDGNSAELGADSHTITFTMVAQ
jgi:hypothetical protein